MNKYLEKSAGLLGLATRALGAGKNIGHGAAHAVVHNLDGVKKVSVPEAPTIEPIAKMASRRVAKKNILAQVDKIMAHYRSSTTGRFEGSGLVKRQ